MPRIQLKDATGRPYQIDSSDPELLCKWLWETLNLTAHDKSHIWPTEIIIYPLFGRDEQPDWPPNASRTFRAELGGSTPADNVRGLAAALEQYATRIEQEL